MAVLDTGIYPHRDFADRVVGNISLYGGDPIADKNGHGTHATGIITRMAVNARLLNIRVGDDKGMVWPTTIAQAITRAMDGGARIINISIATPNTVSLLDDAVRKAWDQGILIVCGAGNNVKGIPMYPAYYDEVLAVAAIDDKGNLWSKSNYGNWVDCYAPGVNIYSTRPNNRYGYESGTSMAAAYVSGTAASIWGDLDYPRAHLIRILKAAFSYRGFKQSI